MSRFGSPYPYVTLTTLELVYEARQEVVLPAFTGTTLRGAFGEALRRGACTTGAPTCEGCGRVGVCVYGLVWEGGVPSPDTPKRFGSAQPAYIFDAPYLEEPGRVRRGERYRFRLTLLGAARAFQVAVVLAARAAGAGGFGQGRGVSQLMEVVRLDPGPAERVIYTLDGGFDWESPGEPWLVEASPAALPSPVVLVCFETPMAIKANGRILERFDPVAFTSRLSTRMELLSMVHEGHGARWDHRALREDAERVVLVESRLSAERFQRVKREGKHVPMEGIFGAVLVAGLTPALWGLWRCAEAVNVGKNAAFGFGRVRFADGVAP